MPIRKLRVSSSPAQVALWVRVPATPLLIVPTLMKSISMSSTPIHPRGTSVAGLSHIEVFGVCIVAVSILVFVVCIGMKILRCVRQNRAAKTCWQRETLAEHSRFESSQANYPPRQTTKYNVDARSSDVSLALAALPPAPEPARTRPSGPRPI